MACSHQLAGSVFSSTAKGFCVWMWSSGALACFLFQNCSGCVKRTRGAVLRRTQWEGQQTSCQHHQGSTVKPALILAHESHLCNHTSWFTTTLKLVFIFFPWGRTLIMAHHCGWVAHLFKCPVILGFVHQDYHSLTPSLLKIDKSLAQIWDLMVSVMHLLYENGLCVLFIN